MRAFLVALLTACIAGPSAYGEILLDGFRLEASAESPLMSNDFVDTEDVGPLSALRRIRILGATTDPTGTLDVGATTPSMLTADLVTINPRQQSSIGIQFWYDFDSVDFTEGSRNNAILIDFLSTSTSGTPLSSRVFIGRDNATLATPVSPEPFTLVIPFESIGADFSQVASLHFTVFTPVLADGGDFALFLEIERVRVGQVVPEPGGIFIVAIAGVWIGARRR